MNMEIAVFGIQESDKDTKALKSLLGILKELKLLGNDIVLFTEAPDLLVDTKIDNYSIKHVGDYLKEKTNDISLVFNNMDVTQIVRGRVNCFVSEKSSKERSILFWNTDLVFDLESLPGGNIDDSLVYKVVAKQWIQSCLDHIHLINKGSAHTRALHFMRRSDIIAAKEVIKSHHDPLAEKIKERLEREWGFLEDKEKFKKHYEGVGQKHGDVFKYIPDEIRYQHVKDWLKNQKGLKRIIDYGCAHSSYGIHLANETGAEWFGVDIDQYSINWSYKNRNQYAKYPERMHFQVGDHTLDLSNEQPFDCLLVMEVLEHVSNPTEVIDSLEKWVKPGGKIFITVPYGPWEYMIYNKDKDRFHLWEFDQHDLKDMFGKKKNMISTSLYCNHCPELNEPLGWNIIEYERSEEPAYPVDLSRKTQFQNPRESVSVNILVREHNSQFLEITLKSIVDIADEINIAFIGVDDNSKKIAGEYHVNVIEISAQMEQGLDMIWNELISNSVMDWTLVLNSGEQINEPANLHKYLKPSMVNMIGFSTRYLSSGPTILEETKLRLFRTKVSEGKYQFKGHIYEDIELVGSTVLGNQTVLTDVFVISFEYTNLLDKAKEIRYNLYASEKDMERFPSRPHRDYCIMKDFNFLNSLDFYQKGFLSDSSKNRCKATIKLYASKFLSNFENKRKYNNALHFYSQACKLLQIGIQVDMRILANNGKNIDINLKRIYFRNINDFQEELLCLLEAEQC